jgi:hypothetical protein
MVSLYGLIDCEETTRDICAGADITVLQSQHNEDQIAHKANNALQKQIDYL